MQFYLIVSIIKIMNKDLEIKLKSISTRVRPPRYVVFVNSNDPHWMFACKHIIEWNSQMWGGHYNLIVPTDGDSIDDTYWEILDAYQPDFFMQYSKTIKDLEECDNKEYRRIEAINTEIFLKNNPGYIKKEAKKVVKDLIEKNSSGLCPGVTNTFPN